MAKLKYTVKDSIFTTLFGEVENALDLYKSLHPEDTTVSIDDCEIITLETVIAPGIYNDLGLQVRDTLILLAEAQSTFSRNVALRVFLYLANTYKEYVMGRNSPSILQRKCVSPALSFLSSTRENRRMSPKHSVSPIYLSRIIPRLTVASKYQ